MTLWLSHELFFWHNTQNWNQFFQPGLTVQPGQHAENPETKRRFRNLAEVSGILDRMTALKPRPATDPELLRFHTQAHVDHLQRVADSGGGDAGELTPTGRGSADIARLAAGAAIVGMEAILTGPDPRAYVLTRPPGHHCLSEKAMGFCLYANAVLAIQHARAVHGVARIATVDWDVHHGNGTEAAFYDDPDVLTISIHQDRLYPQDTGAMSDRGRDRGEGANINIPLPAGSGHGAYLSVMERVVVPALLKFRPEVIVVPCGFDASAMDPLGHMLLHSDSYRAMTALICIAADEVCDGRVLMTHEGGYSADYVPNCGLAVLEALTGARTGIEDPWLGIITVYGGQMLQPHQDTVIRAAESLLPGVPG